MRVSSLPRAFGTGTSVLALMGAAALAGPAAGLFAGTSHALSSASIVTSRLGNGDHHALVALLFTALLVVASAAFRETSLREPRRSGLLGAAAGALAGMALGAWVASLLQVAVMQACLAWLALRHLARPIRGLPAMLRKLCARQHVQC
jgi:asparagine N-glycosylation enzyme membrane subunit Stt3